ncbi:hypothetical protein BD626DRAFT_517662, partial [Schizophyllum amplum]
TLLPISPRSLRHHHSTNIASLPSFPRLAAASYTAIAVSPRPYLWKHALTKGERMYVFKHSRVRVFPSASATICPLVDLLTWLSKGSCAHLVHLHEAQTASAARKLGRRRNLEGCDTYIIDQKSILVSKKNDLRFWIEWPVYVGESRPHPCPSDSHAHRQARTRAFPFRILTADTSVFRGYHRIQSARVLSASQANSVGRVADWHQTNSSLAAAFTRGTASRAALPVLFRPDTPSR